MSYNEIATLYRETSARGSHPTTLVVKLYDAILEDLRRALNAAAVGDIQGRAASLNHSLLVIAELQSVLDRERGGEVAQRLDGFYNVTRALIVEANLHSKAEQMQRLIELFVPLRQAWKQVEEDMAHGGSQGSATLSNPNAARSANALAESADLDRESAQWNA
jgi:flagellar protein FliS